MKSDGHRQCPTRTAEADNMFREKVVPVVLGMIAMFFVFGASGPLFRLLPVSNTIRGALIVCAGLLVFWLVSNFAVARLKKR